MRLTEISHLINKLSILTIPHMLADSQSLIASMKKRIYSGTAVAHIANKSYLAAHMTRYGEIHLSYLPTAEMLAGYFTKPLPKPAFLKKTAAMGIIGIGIGNSLGNGLGILGNGVGTGNGIRNAVGRRID